MTMYMFGSGTVIAKQVGVVNPLPALLGTIQQFEMDIDQTIKELYGQYKFPVAIGAGEGKITCKAKFARIQSPIMNNLIIGGSLTRSAGTNISAAEQLTIPNTTTANSVTVAQSATFIEDLGVFYGSNGVQLILATAAGAAGTYASSSGTYSFNAADKGLAVQIYYDYTVTSLVNVQFTNNLMGQQPTFKLFARESFLFNNVNQELILQLNACVSSKLTLPFKNNDFTVEEMDIMAFADASGTIGNISMTE